MSSNVTFKKGKGSHSLVAVSGNGYKSPPCHAWAQAYEKRSPYLSFRCFYSSLIRIRYPFTAGSADIVFKPRDGIKLVTFCTVVQRCNPLDHLIVACNPLSLQSGSRLTIILKFKEGLSFKVENVLKAYKSISFSIELRVYCWYGYVAIVILNKIRHSFYKSEVLYLKDKILINLKNNREPVPDFITNASLYFC